MSTIRERFERLQQYKATCNADGNDAWESPYESGDLLRKSDVLELADELDAERAQAFSRLKSMSYRHLAMAGGTCACEICSLVNGAVSLDGLG